MERISLVSPNPYMGPVYLTEPANLVGAMMGAAGHEPVTNSIVGRPPQPTRFWGPSLPNK